MVFSMHRERFLIIMFFLIAPFALLDSYVIETLPPSNLTWNERGCPFSHQKIQSVIDVIGEQIGMSPHLLQKKTDFPAIQFECPETNDNSFLVNCFREGDRIVFVEKTDEDGAPENLVLQCTLLAIGLGPNLGKDTTDSVFVQPNAVDLLNDDIEGLRGLYSSFSNHSSADYYFNILS
jgi:hypothetical protein